MEQSQINAQRPCPDRISDDAGYAFTMGACGGMIWHLISGFQNAPKKRGIEFAIQRSRSRFPVLGGNFAVWGGLFAFFDCSLAYLRHKEDILNPILSGSFTGYALAWRSGWRMASKSAIVGGILLALIEGFSISLQKFFMRKQEAMNERMMGLPFSEVQSPSNFMNNALSEEEIPSYSNVNPSNEFGGSTLNEGYDFDSDRFSL